MNKPWGQRQQSLVALPVRLRFSIPTGWHGAPIAYFKGEALSIVATGAPAARQSRLDAVRSAITPAPR
jgi:hypothetical protein